MDYGFAFTCFLYGSTALALGEKKPTPTPTPAPTATPTATPAPTPTPTLTPGPVIGVVSVKTHSISVKQPYDYKIGANGTGHLIQKSGNQFSYQTFDGTKWSQPEIVKDDTTAHAPIPYNTVDARFREPRIAEINGTVWLAWGINKDDGLYVSRKSGQYWTKPIKAAGTQWVEYLEINGKGSDVYLVHANVDAKLHFLKFDGTKFNEYAKPAGLGKDITSFVGPDETWFMTRFYDAVLYPAKTPDSKITIKGMSLPQGEVGARGDFHVAGIMGGTKVIDGKKYYYPKTVNYRSKVKDVVVHTFKTFSDKDLMAGKGWGNVGGIVGLTTLGGNPRVIWDFDKVLYMKEIKNGVPGDEVQLGTGSNPLVKTHGNRADVISVGGTVYSLQLK